MPTSEGGVYRLAPKGKEIVDKYHYGSVTQTLVGMDRDIERLKSESGMLTATMTQKAFAPTSMSSATSCMSTATYTAKNFSPDYWNTMRDTIVSVTSSNTMNTPVPKFEPAKNFKVIGKIDPDEQLQEPVGKQGRSVS